MNKNIYLSEPGIICCAGCNPSDFFKAVTEGNQNFIQKVKCSLDEDSDARSFYAGKIPDEYLSPTEDRFDMRILRILDNALEQLRPTVEKAVKLYGKERVAVCIGSCDNGSELSLKAHRALFSDGKLPDDYDIKIQGADYPAVFAAEKSGVKGITLAFSTACSSSASAVIKASELIESGKADAVIAGGVDIASDTVLLGFNSLESVSETKTNPFSINRSGITLGEAASVFVLSKDDIDSTGIILAGTGESADASHMTAPLADGSGAAQAMKKALSDADMNPADIDYINLHGTGTKLNDSMEGKAVHSIFGSKTPVSSTKSVTGHTLGAAGSLELAACFYAIRNKKLPVHVWDGIRDPEIPELNFVSKDTKSDRIKCCMSNSFAFGGCNASLIIRQV